MSCRAGSSPATTPATTSSPNRPCTTSARPSGRSPGQRDDAFDIDIASIFDIATLRPFQGAHALSRAARKKAATTFAVAGGTRFTPDFNAAPNHELTDGVIANDKPFLNQFPYLATPHRGLPDYADRLLRRFGMFV